MDKNNIKIINEAFKKGNQVFLGNKGITDA